MKTNRLFLYAAALMVTAACAKEVAPEVVTPEINAPEYAVSFTAFTENAPEAKATVGTSNAGKPQTFWEDGDKISVYSSANMSTSARSSYIFRYVYGTQTQGLLQAHGSPHVPLR